MIKLLLLALILQTQSIIPLHNFKDIGIWKPNPDGGHPPAITTTEAGMKITYASLEPQWGNLVGPCSVPDNATALRIKFAKLKSTGSAALHIWLIEPDNDMWLQEIRDKGKSFGQMKAGVHAVSMPIAGFQFDGRGRKTKEMTTANRMLIGCNYGDLEVTMMSMEWETQTGLTAVQLPDTPKLAIEHGPRGNLAILRLKGPLPDGFEPSCTPDRLATFYKRAGYGVTILQPGDLANSSTLNRKNFDAVVLPYGPNFPEIARDTFTAYLRSGGGFLSLNGYAFDDLVEWTGAKWQIRSSLITAASTSEGIRQVRPMNTRTGQRGDAMNFSPEQIAVFDPSFLLTDAHIIRMEGRPNSPIKPGKPIKGFAAVGLTGCNNPVFPPVYRRWTPILQAYDSGGTVRGPVLSVMRNFDGEYKGSAWAFCGLTSGGEFLLNTETGRDALLSSTEKIVCNAYLHTLASDMACYRAGETANLSVEAVNHGAKDAKARVDITVNGIVTERREFTLKAGQSLAISGKYKIKASTPDYVPVVARLILDNNDVDEISSAFCVWNEKIVATGPRLAWQNNYITIDGRATFLAGTNQTGMVFYSPDESPATWERDFKGLENHNIHILRLLHFSPFAKNGYQGQSANSPFDLANRPERLCRQLDGLVQLAQKHRVAIFLSLHDWMGVGLTDDELKAEADWNRFWAERYKNVPGILFDVQNEPSVDVPDRPDIVKLWNDFLQDRYGSDEALKTAWRVNPAEAALPNVPLGKTTDEWDDVRSADRKRFEAVVLNRWLKANVAGVKAGNPNAPVCVGYLPSMDPADKLLGVKYTDFSNMHYYGSIEGMPLEFKLVDRRFVGKGFSIGEFGAQEAQSARNAGENGYPTEISLLRFRAVIHYAVGLGAAFVQNWCWKEFDEMVFPWGLVERCTPVARPWLHEYSQSALFLSFVEPVYQSPNLFLLAPDRNRVGPRFNALNDALHRSVELLLNQRVNFGVVNEEDIDHLPESAKVLVWPLPYCPADATFNRVLDWVRKGGTLYLSGEIGFDANRMGNRPDRRRNLGLPAAEPVSPFNAPSTTWDMPPIETNVGSGKVLFAPYPLELKHRDGDASVYSRLLAMAHIDPIRIEPEQAPVRALSIPLREGGKIFALLRSDTDAAPLSVKLPECGVELVLKQQSGAFVVVNANNEVVAAESDGALVVNGKTIARADGHFGLVAIDKKPLLSSGEWLVLPNQERRITLSMPASLTNMKCTCITPEGERSFIPIVDGMIQLGYGRIAVIAKADAMKQAVSEVKKRTEIRR